MKCAFGRNRTDDLSITSAAPYRLATKAAVVCGGPKDYIQLRVIDFKTFQYSLKEVSECIYLL